MKKQGGLSKIAKFLFILAFVSIGFFIASSVTNTIRAEQNPAVIINEVAWMGSAENANAEWVELKNNTDSAIDLSGWKLVSADGIPSINLTGNIGPGAFYLLERTSDDSVPNIPADLIYVGAMGNSGEKLTLIDNGGNTVDMIDAAGGWSAGDNTTKATMEKGDDGSWHTSAIVSGTPKVQNTVAEPSNPVAVCGNGNLETGETCDDGNLDNNDGCSSACLIEPQNNQTDTPPVNNPTTNTNSENKYKLGDVLINEFVSDPGDNDSEWIELYNFLGQEIDLPGWYIEEGSNSKTILSGKLGATGSVRFFVVEKPKGSLNNDGDTIKLYCKTGTLIDKVNYGKWNEGGNESNAPMASDPNSTARLYDGYNTFNNKNDFGLTNQPTKGESNVIVNSEDEISAEDKSKYDFSDDIVITEILPNPAGPDNEKEFIEIYNKGDRDANLDGWSLADASGQRYQIGPENSLIKAKGFMTIYRTDSKIALNNNYDSVLLFKPLTEKVFVTVKYKDTKEGWSYDLDTLNNKWIWSEKITPGSENLIISLNHEPQVSFDCPENIILGQPFIFDSSDTYDQDNDKLKYEWDLGDGAKSKLETPQHTYLKAGSFNVVLKVSDGSSEGKKECILNVVKELNMPTTELAIIAGDSVRINELMPNPDGADAEGEWIELYNYGQVKINMLNWRLDDGEIGSPYNFSESFWLEAGKYLVLEREETKLALNNDNDSLRLFGADNKQKDLVEYSGAKEGYSYAINKNSKWAWTIKPTPGESNEIVLSPATVKNIKSVGAKKNPTGYSQSTLDKVSEFSIGDTLEVTGQVIVLPGIFGTQYFYISGTNGLQVYNYKKDFPAFKIGDVIKVKGEISEINGEKRLKTKTRSDMIILENKPLPPLATTTADKLNESLIGKLIAIAGEVIDVKGSSIFLDDGSDEAEIYIKSGTGINIKTVKVGDNAKIIGIPSKTKTGIRILPRSQDDIVVNGQIEKGKVLGEVSESDAWTISQRDKKAELFKYLLAIAVTIIFILIIFMVKYKKEDKKEENKIT